MNQYKNMGFQKLYTFLPLGIVYVNATLKFEPAHNKTYNKIFVTCKDSAQPVQSHSMVRFLVYPSLDSVEAVEDSCDQRSFCIFFFQKTGFDISYSLHEMADKILTNQTRGITRVEGFYFIALTLYATQLIVYQKEAKLDNKTFYAILFYSLSALPRNRIRVEPLTTYVIKMIKMLEQLTF